MNYASLDGTDFSYTDLLEVNLSGTDLRLANLKYANLSEAKLSGAKLSDANLNDAEKKSNLKMKDAAFHALEQIKKAFPQTKNLSLDQKMAINWAKEVLNNKDIWEKGGSAPFIEEINKDQYQLKAKKKNHGK